MCELFGVTANRRVNINELLGMFFSHSVEHRNGWGLAFLDDASVSIEKEPVRASDSFYLRNRLTGRIETARCMAHIRKATMGEVSFNNTHPFSRRDEAGRCWVLVHNGTIFEAPVLSSYQYKQEGQTDSERILMYIVDEVNKHYEDEMNSFDVNERIRLVDRIVKKLAPENKLNIILYDGDYFYVHKNEEGTLYKSEKNGAVIFSTHPLKGDSWEEVPGNQLFVYKDGELIYEGKKHPYSYVQDPEKMKLLYLGFAGL
ncbi:MAG: class II glutamine amidotransferase [Lachnospiraceae bacterium]|nr:class II glutamine amidotransferase [Lachnospiraceae bacterium]